MINQFENIYKGKKILITGDTGFKGSWLAIWLLNLGAEVYGYALPAKTNNDNYLKSGLKEKINHLDGDIRNLEKLKDYFISIKPEIVFHLAAQPLVIDSYKDPHYTFETNIMGTVNFFEAVRTTPSIKVAVNITSDKCYLNKEWIWGYRENESLGGDDPYSASKGSSEIITNSYIKSFLNDRSIYAASARAGNVIGGGDWADNRIIPDFFRSFWNQEKLIIRNPESTRPWQHVLEPLSGYLFLASKLYTEGKDFVGSWNFGPIESSSFKVIELIKKLQERTNYNKVEVLNTNQQFHEANLLRLDISKATNKLKWHPTLDLNQTIEFVFNGYQDELDNDYVYEKRINQINEYVLIAQQKKIAWALR